MKTLLFSISLLFLFSCSRDPQIVKPEMPFQISVPRNLANEMPQPSDNMATAEGIALGKKLFFDPILSGNSQISCATCHRTNLAFSDGLTTSNRGSSGKFLLRNTPSLFNLAWANGYFADGGAKNLESQVFGPLQSEDEMNANISDLIHRLNASIEYKQMTKQAFGSDTINSTLLVKAIAQFERTLISGNSKYDTWVRNEGESLNSLELKGLDVFKNNCEACHKADFFTDFGYHNNGLDSAFNNNSFENIFQGRYRITGNTDDIGKFKTPSLRNLSFTAPYMHDGRFATIDEVISHYNSRIQYFPTLDSRIPKEGFQLSADDILALKAFLKTLDDYDFVAKSILLNPK